MDEERVDDDTRAELTLLDLAGQDSDEAELTWQERALCAQTDPEAFFPDPGSHARYAKSVCAACPVRDECLEFVMDLHRKGMPQAGVWGMTTSHERKELMAGADRTCPDCGTVTVSIGNTGCPLSRSST